ncbi:hypothetical protein ALICE_30 [Mycobacterium phage Alice]|uniref:Uncharacterized protein n=3 Tax=Bixzunavirus TaxID=680114 RepID=A0A7M1CTV5_9CAUD|nr:hypothetical protein HYRO_35 [Mycobacterium phage HyRo]YP_009216295.1 hypothetical protein ALICE_30 [Mycobacterium phage Alice]AVR57263.1 hypothetical protein SEA_MIKELIESIN_37 [Mycobacterium phage MikeLiesIn]AXN53867.1 hypothetical protein SEA_RABINOVISH_34 [Mycobacterium phage Rabinovish]AYD81793.1 hypothetical protein SEA_ROOTS515_36 [Mycobacterium phage Roots515]QAX93797.1 hypothetical protein SEA_SHELOB_37 [Mycobacterium phage Shelob]QAY09864.1 hypothetical protein PBI_FLABSLAB_36 [My
MNAKTATVAQFDELAAANGWVRIDEWNSPGFRTWERGEDRVYVSIGGDYSQVGRPVVIDGLSLNWKAVRGGNRRGQLIEILSA